jgi:mannose-1-phosphate guanylyltransferase
MTQRKPIDSSRTQPLANLHGMIICANSASHLWPLSRERAPLELASGTADGRSPLAKAIEAVRPYCTAPLIIAAPRDIALHVKRHIAEHALLADGDFEMLVEPHPRGSALTTALVAATVKLADPHAILLCLPATVAFDPDDRWEQALRRAHRSAAQGKIALVGSSAAPLAHGPDARGRASASANTSSRAYGQAAGKTPPLIGAIRMGREYEKDEGVFQVRGFIARPAPVVAWRAEQGRSLWSSHIFMLGADLALAELRAAGRESNDPFMHSVQRIAETARFFVSLGSEHWSSQEAAKLVETLPELSFEEAVFETTRQLAVVPTSLSFTDLTTLAGYEQTVAADARGNRLRGRALAVQTEGSTVLADGEKLVVALGLKDAIVIDTADATLVTTRNALASMPSVMAALRSAEAPEL